MLNLIYSIYDYSSSIFSIIFLTYIFRFFFHNCIINNTLIKDNKFKTVSKLKFGLAMSYLFIITTLYYTFSFQTIMSFLALLLLFSLWTSESSNVIKILSKYDNHDSVKPVSIFIFRSCNTIMKVLTPIHILIDFNIKKFFKYILSTLNNKLNNDDINNLLSLISIINKTKLFNNNSSSSSSSSSSSTSSRSSSSSSSSSDDNLEAYYINDSDCNSLNKSYPNNTESSNTKNSNTESSNTESSNTESSNTESSNTESSNTESSNTESSNTEKESDNTSRMNSSEILGGDKLLDRINEVINRKYQ